MFGRKHDSDNSSDAIRKEALDAVLGSSTSDVEDVDSRVEYVSKEAYEFEARVFVKEHNKDFYPVVVHNRAEMRNLLGSSDVMTNKIRLKNNVSVFYDKNCKLPDEGVLVSGSIRGSDGGIHFWIGTAIFLADDGVAPIDMSDELLSFVKDAMVGKSFN